MGTVGYMAPEQVRGEPADHRADIFAFGAILYEMLTGKRAFHGTSAVETMGTILKDEPPSLAEMIPAIPPGLQRIIQRCLEKDPGQRFRSSSDLGFALESLSAISDAKAGSARTKIAQSRRTRNVAIVLSLLGVAFLTGVGVLANRRLAHTTPIRFEDVVLRRGQFGQARFAPDTRTVVYSAGFRFGDRGIYVADANTQVGRPLNMLDVALLAISRKSELAVLLSPHQLFEHASNAWVGTLARVPLSGGTPRPVLENVQSADWSPDGSKLAISRYIEERNTYTLEYPIGKVLYETKGYISDIRVSPDAELVAFMDHPILGDDMGWVAVVDHAGKRRMISPDAWPKTWSERGLAWSPSGKEVWFTNQNGLWAADLHGRTRALFQMAGYALHLLDIGQDGSLLLYQSGGDSSMILQSWTKPFTQRDLSWLDLSIVTDISNDGKVVLFSEEGTGVAPDFMMFVRKTDGSPPLQLGPGRSGAISPDGQSAITIGVREPLQLYLVPVGMGDTRQLTNDSINHYEAHWLPDNTHFVYAGQETGHGVRGYIQSTRDAVAKPITPEGCAPQIVSPDGVFILAECIGQSKWKIFPLKGGPAFEPRGLHPSERPLSWTKDNSLWILNGGPLSSVQIVKVNPNTGARELWREVHLDSFSGIQNAVITPDGNTFVHTDWANSGSLCRVFGLR